MRLLVGLAIGVIGLAGFARAGEFYQVVLSQGSTTSAVNTTLTVTARVLDGGMPVPGQTVQFTAGGAGSCTTNASGACSVGVMGPLFPGEFTITGCSGSPPTCGTVTHSWQLPASTGGLATGGGAIMPPGPSDTEEVIFGFSAGQHNGGLKGKCLINDDNTNVMVKCLDIFAYVQVGPHAFFYGSASINGFTQQYRMDVNDGGEGGGAIDTFSLVTSGDYVLAGTVVKGNIQVHAP